MTIHELEQACEKVVQVKDYLTMSVPDQVCAINLDKWEAERNFYRLSLALIPKLLAFVKAWDELEACLQDSRTGAKEVQAADDKLAAAREALEG